MFDQTAHKRPFILTVVVRKKNASIYLETATDCAFEACVEGENYIKYMGCYAHQFTECGTYHIHFRGDMDGLKVRDRFLPDTLNYKQDALKWKSGKVRHRDEFERSMLGRKVDYHFAFDFLLFAKFEDYEYVFIDIKQWGDYAWRNVQSMFFDCLFIQCSATDAPNLSYVDSLSYLFGNAASFNSNIEHWDISHITDLSNMFHGAHSFNQPLDKWDTSHVTDMHGLFHGAQFFNQPIGNWDTSNVNNMSEMFSDAWEFDQPIGEWDTSLVKDMHEMFCGATHFNQPIGSWNTQNVCDMGGMFYNARHFNQPIGDWNTQNVENMSFMFCDARAFNQSLMLWNTSHVSDMSYMFGRAVSFNQSVEQWDMSCVQSAWCMFAYAVNFAHSIAMWNIRGPVEINYTLHGTKVDIQWCARRNRAFYYCHVNPEPFVTFLPPEGVCKLCLNRKP